MKYLSRKFIIAILVIVLCAVAFIVGNETVKFISVLTGGVVAISYMFADSLAEMYKDDDEIIEHKIIGFKEDENE